MSAAALCRPPANENFSPFFAFLAKTRPKPPFGVVPIPQAFQPPNEIFVFFLFIFVHIVLIPTYTYLFVGPLRPVDELISSTVCNNNGLYNRVLSYLSKLIKTHPNHGGRRRPTAAMAPHPRRRRAQQSTNMIVDKSMLLKVEDLIVFTIY